MLTKIIWRFCWKRIIRQAQREFNGPNRDGVYFSTALVCKAFSEVTGFRPDPIDIEYQLNQMGKWRLAIGERYWVLFSRK